MTRLNLSLVALLVLCQCAAASAQEAHSLELAASYQLLKPLCQNVSCWNYPIGWQGSAAARVIGPLSAVVEIGGNLKRTATSRSETISPPNLTSATLTSSSTTTIVSYDFLAGPRLDKLLTPNVRAFAGVSFGVWHGRVTHSSSLGIPDENAQTSTSSSGAATHFVWQPGVGIDVTIATKWAVRAGMDYRISPVLSNSLKTGDILVIAGVAFYPYGREAATRH